MKASSVVGILSAMVIVAQVLVFASLGLSLYTTGQSTAETFGRGPEAINFTGDIDPDTGAFRGSISLVVKNAGMLDISFLISVSLLSEDGTLLYAISEEGRVAAGSSSGVELPISLPGSVAQLVDRANFKLEMKTLFDLVGFSITIQVPVGHEEQPPPR